MKKLLVIVCVFSISHVHFAQIKLDSLWLIWNDNSQPDTNRLKAINNIVWDGYLFTKPDSAFYYAQLQYELAVTTNNKKWIANALKIQGVSFYLRGNYKKSLYYYNKSLKIYEEIKDKKGIGSILNNIGLIHRYQGNYTEAIDSYNKSLKITEEIGDKNGIANTLLNIGVIYKIQGEYNKAIGHYQKCLSIKEEIGDKQGTANSLLNIGLVFQDHGNYDKAIINFNNSLKIYEEIGDQNGIAQCYNDIANIYYDQEDHEKALEYYNKNLKTYELIENRQGIVGTLSNIGNVYYTQDNYKKAIDYYNNSYKIAQEIGNKKGMANALNNIGIIYNDLSNYKKAIDNHNESLVLRKEINDRQGIATSMNNIGIIYYKQGYYKKAISYSKKALSIAIDLNISLQTKNASNALFKAYKANGQNLLALEMHELYIKTRDAIQSKENQKEIINQEYKHQYEKQADSLKSEQAKKEALTEAEQLRKDDISQKESEKKNLIISAGAALLLLIILFTIFIINRLRITKKQKFVIEQQKTEVEQQKTISETQKLIVEEKNKEIIDSINYAKRIQAAILPPKRLIEDILDDSFILYKPKDIVAGDFYWIAQKDDKVMFAAADCTGHGVPGAMVSVICNNGLNRAVREYGLTEPGLILDKTRKIVVQEFEKSEDDVKDGMDIALCTLFGNKLEYAGAHNPLWIIRNDELIETKANKQPIGKFENPLPFTTHNFDLQKGDMIYIFSDGFSDQFGGEKGKKFKSANFKKLLLRIHNKSMEKQKSIINETFDNWKSNLEQLDDVCVIGVRV